MLTGDRLVMEVGGKDGVDERGITVRGLAPGEDSICSAFRRLLWTLVASPLVVGLSRFWTPIGREDRWSGGVDDGGGVGRADPFCEAETFEAPFGEIPGEAVLLMGGSVLDPKGGRRLLLSCGELDEGRDVAGRCDMWTSAWYWRFPGCPWH